MGSAKNKVRFYLRPVNPRDDFGEHSDPAAWIPEGTDMADVELTLSFLDDKEYVSHTFFRRLQNHLVDKHKIPMRQAGDLLIRRMGWPYVESVTQSCNVLEKDLERRLQARKDHAAKVLEDQRKKLLKGTGQGRYGAMGREFGQNYFFVTRPEFKEFLETLLREHNDCYLQEAVNRFPVRMTWEAYHKSFGVFWQSVLFAHNSGACDFTEPGLDSVKRLAHYLFTWNFRRYLSSDVIFRHARFLPRQYRIDHVAAWRDKDTTILKDDDYDELPFEDDVEEPDDNIGNR
jgi:hypothetical protein